MALAGGVHDGTAAIAAPHRDQSLGFQYPQRFSQRYQAHVELFDEHFLAREQVAVDEFTLDDLPSQFVGDDLGGAAGAEPATRLGSDSQRCHVLAILTAIASSPAVAI